MFSSNDEQDPLEDEQAIIDEQNKEPGSLTGYDCPVCLNRGFFWGLDENGAKYTRRCGCMVRRGLDKRMAASGLGDMAERYTLEKWETRYTWQREARELVQGYVRRGRGWLLVCGKTGAGKTHLCTAALTKLIEQGKHGCYFLWRDEARRLKALVTDAAAYEGALGPYKRVEVLYIDDLFKGRVTEADLNLAYELLNARYNDSRKLTIISTECTPEQLKQFDEAIFGRISERSDEGCSIDLRGSRNWRLDA